MNVFFTLFLQGQPSAIGSFLPFLLLILVLYFFMIRPQVKRQKEEAKFAESLLKGMRIVTAAGIHGKILEVGDTYIILESENSRLKINKSAVSKELSQVYSDLNTPILSKKEVKESEKK
ncbi:preprotein translocase subunit YajC [Schleiferia thermophila]|jgi:preprotein translocase subunit YajC|uniref:preprotein translocase subunit YajC n=1 Tax=Schleiferia thermophila TaxID=884107 RepID=UPI000CB915DB|nr:preprotein translocase subunit YajC [Fischerella thermalis CCMEE 5319]